MHFSNKILQVPVFVRVMIECTKTLLPHRKEITSDLEVQNVIIAKIIFTVTSDICISHSTLMWKTEILPHLANNKIDTIDLNHRSTLS